MTFCQMMRFGLSVTTLFFVTIEASGTYFELPDTRTTDVDTKSSNASKHKTKQETTAEPASQSATKKHLYGELVEGGVECQRFRSADGKYYTLEGDLRGFRTGDKVEITGIIPTASHCMQDTPLHVRSIRRAKPPKSGPAGKSKDRILRTNPNR